MRTRIGPETAGLKGAERDAVVLKIKGEERTAEATIAPAVAGFNLTFSAPKSVSVAWAPADGCTAGLILEAYQQALAYVVGDAEQRVFTSLPLAAICVGPRGHAMWTRGLGTQEREQLTLPADVLG